MISRTRKPPLVQTRFPSGERGVVSYPFDASLEPEATGR